MTIKQVLQEAFGGRFRRENRPDRSQHQSSRKFAVQHALTPELNAVDFEDSRFIDAGMAELTTRC